MGGIKLESDEFAVGRQGAREPDGAVSAESSDLEDAFGSLDSGEEMKEFALVGSDVDCGQAGAGVCLDGVVERLVRVDEIFADVCVD